MTGPAFRVACYVAIALGAMLTSACKEEEPDKPRVKMTEIAGKIHVGGPISDIKPLVEATAGAAKYGGLGLRINLDDKTFDSIICNVDQAREQIKACILYLKDGDYTKGQFKTFAEKVAAVHPKFMPLVEMPGDKVLGTYSYHLGHRPNSPFPPPTDPLSTAVPQWSDDGQKITGGHIALGQSMGMTGGLEWCDEAFQRILKTGVEI